MLVPRINLYAGVGTGNGIVIKNVIEPPAYRAVAGLIVTGLRPQCDTSTTYQLILFDLTLAGICMFNYSTYSSFLCT